MGDGSRSLAPDASQLLFGKEGSQLLFGNAVFGEQENMLRRVIEDVESQTAQAMEQLVASEGFSELMATFTANTVALTRISSDVMDLVLRNLRIAGRTDLDRLARQLARTEDKLELLLQAVERLEDTSHRQ